jgi:hypothetical protein
MAGPLEPLLGDWTTAVNDCTNSMMTKVQTELPAATAKAARGAGLLTPRAHARIVSEAVRRRRAADWLLSIADRVDRAGVPRMSMQEVDSEVKAVRARRSRRARRP